MCFWFSINYGKRKTQAFFVILAFYFCLIIVINYYAKEKKKYTKIKQMIIKVYNFINQDDICA